jgi:hypothetical protein
MEVSSTERKHVERGGFWRKEQRDKWDGVATGTTQRESFQIWKQLLAGGMRLQNRENLMG